MNQQTTSVEQLKQALAGRKNVRIVDIRPESDFDDWHIPGAQNMPVLDAMRSDDPEPLLQRAHELSGDEPVVFVCNVGRSSLKAAQYIEQRGVHATSLDGGMVAWSAVHSEARILIPSSPKAVCIQVRRNAKGCLSYSIGSDGDAAVFDPSVDASVYEAIATREELNIQYVIETHVHADHVSRARDLAHASGATLCLPTNDRARFEYRALEGDDELKIGSLTLRVIETPGHTGESVCYLINNELLLTGDTLFVDSVGRPDLEKGDEGAIAGAEMLFQSLHEHVLALDDSVLILPGHTNPGVPFDGEPIAAELRKVKQASDLLTERDQGRFVQSIVERIGAKPPSHHAIIRINESAEVPDDDLLELEYGPNRCAVGM